MKIEFKYPRTWHLPFSEGLGNDDKIMPEGIEGLLGVPLVLTEKMDGSNITLTRAGVIPRARWHESMGPLKALHAGIAYSIPESYLITGEWLLAKHSIKYDRLRSYYQVFGIIDMERKVFLSWEETEEFVQLMDLTLVPVLERNVVCRDEEDLKRIVLDCMEKPPFQGEDREGVVVRVMSEIPLNEFGRLTGKYVRAGHVPQDAEHWSKGSWERNLLERSNPSGRLSS